MLYGSVAIAVPLMNLEIEVGCSPTLFESSVDTDGFRGRLRDLPENFAGISFLVGRMLGARRANLHFKSSIPQSAGLGSSAASSLALARSINSAFSLGFKEEEILDLCSAAEDRVHGKASGLDLFASAHGSPILFSKGSSFPLPPLGSSLLVVYSGEAGRTKSAIEKVSQDPDKERIMADLRKTCEKAKESWSDPERVGESMTEAHGLLRKLGLSTSRLERIVKKCMDLGSLGAKLTGSGLGGCAIGLFKDRSQAERAQKNLSDFSSWVEEI